jgi:hypothetical protein
MKRIPTTQVGRRGVGLLRRTQGGGSRLVRVGSTRATCARCGWRGQAKAATFHRQTCEQKGVS